MSHTCPTVKVLDEIGKRDFIIINESDFDKKINTKYVETKKPKKAKAEKEEKK